MQCSQKVSVYPQQHYAQCGETAHYFWMGDGMSIYKISVIALCNKHQKALFSDLLKYGWKEITQEEYLVTKVMVS